VAGLLVVLALVVVNGLFAGAEIAVLTLRRTRLDELVEEERAGAKALAALRADPEGFLATVQIGITLVGAAAAAFGGATLSSPLAAVLEAAGAPREIADDVALAVVVVVVSFLSLVVGELVPKSLAMRFAERYALVIARPLAFLSRLARPAVRFLTACSNVVLRLFGDRTSFVEARLSRDELRTLVEETATTGGLDPRAGEIAARALDLPGVKVGAVMTPRPSVVSIDATASREEIVAVVGRSRFARFPVHDGGLDGVTGYVLGREVLARVVEGAAAPLQGIVREAPFFPETVEALAVLRELQERHVPIGFVVDEQGGFTGLVTLEDLLEELVGEIFHEKEAAAVPYREDGPGAWVVEGRAGVRDVNRALDLELPEDPAWATIAGFVLHRLERIPPPGTSFVDEESGLTIEVVESTPRQIARVRLSRSA
jgi:putative hemolysin